MPTPCEPREPQLGAGYSFLIFGRNRIILQDEPGGMTHFVLQKVPKACLFIKVNTPHLGIFPWAVPSSPDCVDKSSPSSTFVRK